MSLDSEMADGLREMESVGGSPATIRGTAVTIIADDPTWEEVLTEGGVEMQRVLNIVLRKSSSLTLVPKSGDPLVIDGITYRIFSVTPTRIDYVCKANNPNQR